MSHSNSLVLPSVTNSFHNIFSWYAVDCVISLLGNGEHISGRTKASPFCKRKIR